MSDSYDDYELKIQLAEHAWEEHVDEIVNTEHNKQIEIAQAYERGWNAALAQREWVPEALRLADALDELDRQFSRNGLCGDAAAELRRLHEVNQDLLKALNTILNICLLDNGHWAKTIEREAHEAIAKATGEKS
jgi:hypothetical protein